METGKRILKESLVIRTSNSVGTIPAGKTIEITQVDAKNKQVLVCSEWIKMDVIERISESIPPPA